MLVGKEELDNAVPKWALDALGSHPSFHGSISKMEAVNRLVEFGRNCYLTRYSNFHNFCILSVFSVTEEGGEMLHHIELKIPRDSSKACSVAGERFKDISELVDHYQKNPLKNIEELGECLQSSIGRSFNESALAGALLKIPQDKEELSLDEQESKLLKSYTLWLR